MRDAVERGQAFLKAARQRRFDVIFLGERLTATSIVGGLVIVAGVVLANTELFRRSK